MERICRNSTTIFAQYVSCFKVSPHYRKLNDQTLPDVHPLPRLYDIIYRIGNENPLYSSTIDLLSGFFQVSLDPKSSPYTAFSFKGGHNQFTKLAQEMKNSPASFSRLMQLILSGIQYFICLCYIDETKSPSSLEHSKII